MLAYKGKQSTHVIIQALKERIHRNQLNFLGQDLLGINFTGS